MRAALVVSFLVHLVIIASAIVSLPSSEGFATAPPPALPIEIVTVDELTEITEGDAQETEIALAPAPETVEAEEPALPETMPGANEEEADVVAREEDAVVSPDRSAAPAPAGEPEPTPEPDVVEEAAEPEPVPEPPTEPEETAAAEPEPEREPEAEPEPAEPEPTEEALPAPTEPEPEAEETPAFVPSNVVPTRRPTPPRPTQQAREETPREDAFNADEIASLLSRARPSGGGTGAAQASAGVEGGGLNAPQTATWMAIMREVLRECWIRPAGVTQREELAIVVRMRLAVDGSIIAIDDVRARGVGPIFDIAADAARRAVRKCAPFTFLPPQDYHLWGDFEVVFDPRELL